MVPGDNVATAMGDLGVGPVRMTGKGANGLADLAAAETVVFGHKIALKDIQPGEPIIKYGAIIGEATQAIQKGMHVHLHNMKSRYDERAASFDPVTAASTDMEYNVY